MILLGARADLVAPLSSPDNMPAEIVEIVKIVRLNLYNQDLFCGAQAIHWEMEDLGVEPLPSIRTINRILSRHGLTQRRTGKYEERYGLSRVAVCAVKPDASSRSGRAMLSERSRAVLQSQCDRYGNGSLWVISIHVQVQPVYY